jgi:Domain of unknown function (DUF4394)
MKTTLKIRSLIAVSLCLASVSTAKAERVFGLETNNTLFTFDSATPGTTTTVGALSGSLLAGQSFVGMDFRPATKELIAMSYNTSTLQGFLYKVNTSTATFTPIGTGFILPAGNASSRWGFDIDPVNDQARGVNGNDRNFTINLTTGRQIYPHQPIFTVSLTRTALQERRLAPCTAMIMVMIDWLF